MAFDRFTRTCSWNFFNTANRLLAEVMGSQVIMREPVLLKNLNPTTDCIDAELAGHVHKLDVKLQSFVGVAFLCLLCACLSSLATLE